MSKVEFQYRMTHLHRIIPGHMGGTYVPSNVVKLTVEQHAEAHRLLFEKHRYEEDRIAWLALSGQIRNEDAYRMALKTACGTPEFSKLMSRKRKAFCEKHPELAETQAAHARLHWDGVVSLQHRTKLSQLGREAKARTATMIESARKALTGKPKSEAHRAKLREVYRLAHST